MPEKKRFIVLSTQRSGSCWFLDLLDRQEGLFAYGEIFAKRPKNFNYQEKNKVPDIRYYEYSREHKKSVFSYLKYIYGQVYSERYIGFKLMYHHLNPGLYAYLFFRKNYIIHLVRRNTFLSLLSKEYNTIYRVGHNYRGRLSKQVFPPIHIHPRKFYKSVRRLERHKKLAAILLKLSLKPHLTVYYEDLVSHEATTIKAVYEFMGISQQEVQTLSGFQKIDKRQLKDRISNYDEVMTYFKSRGISIEDSGL